jgi:hypothetical protein
LLSLLLMFCNQTEEHKATNQQTNMQTMQQANKHAIKHINNFYGCKMRSAAWASATEQDGSETVSWDGLSASEFSAPRDRVLHDSKHIQIQMHIAFTFQICCQIQIPDSQMHALLTDI